MVLSFLSHFCSAIEFEFSHPDSVRINEEFEVKISSSESEVYDVKIFVHKSETEKAKSQDYISEIYNDGWKSSWNYIKGAFPEEKTFKVQVLSNEGERNICVRLRKSGTDSTSLKCGSIRVNEEKEKSQPENNEESEDEPEDEPNEDSEKEPKKSQPENTEENFTAISAEIIETVRAPVQEEFQEEKIILKSPGKPSQEIVTKEQGSRNFILYLTIFLLVFLVILLSFKAL